MIIVFHKDGHSFYAFKDFFLKKGSSSVWDYIIL